MIKGKKVIHLILSTELGLGKFLDRLGGLVVDDISLGSVREKDV